MQYASNAFGTILIIVLLVYLSHEDYRTQRIENWELAPCLIIGITLTFYKIISSGISIQIYSFGFYLIGIGFGIFLYYSGFFGGADLKIMLILFMVLDPTKKYGITPNLDGIQFFFYFLVSVLMFLMGRMMQNFIAISKTKYQNNSALDAREILFLCISCRFGRVKKISLHETILLKIGLKELNLLHSINSDSGVFCWSNKIIPIFPLITISLVLTVFT